MSFCTPKYPAMFLHLCTQSHTITVDTIVLPMKSTRNMCILIAVALKQRKKKNSVALVRERTIPAERPPPVGEVSANFCG